MSKHPKIPQEWVPLFEEFLTYLRINSKEVVAVDARGAPLNLWRSQKIALKTIIKGLEEGAHSFMFGKGRQQGISTIFEALTIFWLAMNNGMMGASVIDKEENRLALRAKMTHYMNSFPKGFFGKNFEIVSDNRDFMKFSNNSRLDFIVAGTSKKKEHWGEGRGYAFAHLSEVSKYGSAAGLASFRETLSETNPNRLFIYESTSKGLNHWKEMWDEYGRDTFGKRRAFIGWWAKELNMIPRNDPRFEVYGAAAPDPMEQELIDEVRAKYNFRVSREQLAWYRYKHSDTSVTDQDMAQNHPWTAEQSFVATGFSFFQSFMVGENIDIVTSKENPVRYKGYKYLLGNNFWESSCEEITDPARKGEIVLRVWEEPEPEGHYVIGVDPAYGRDAAKDRHCVSVWRAFGDKVVQVAEYADNAIDTRQCAWVVAHLAGAYRNCIVNPEVTGPGGVMINELENLRERIQHDPYFDRKDKKNENWDDFLSNARWYLWKKPDHFSATGVKGFNTNWKTKIELMELTRDKYVTNRLVIRSLPLLEEMMTVIRDGDTIEAPAPLHDDRVIGMALAVRAWSDSLEMPLLAQGVLYDEYVKALSGEKLDSTSKMLNNIVRDFINRKVEDADTIRLTPEEQWLYDHGLR